LIYGAPAVVMLALHATLANQYTRYNLILIGPFAAGAAWMLVRMASQLEQWRLRWSRARVPQQPGDKAIR